MLHELTTQIVKAVLVTGMGVFGFLATTDGIQDEKLFGISVGVIRELGSFGLIVVLVLGVLWLFKKAVEIAVPKFVQFLEKTTETFLAELEKTREGHAAEMVAERAARERSVDALREMLAAHKHDLGVNIDKLRETAAAGNELTEQMIQELHERPCQMKKTHNEPSQN